MTCPKCQRKLKRWWPNPLRVVNLWRCPRCGYQDCFEPVEGDDQ